MFIIDFCENQETVNFLILFFIKFLIHKQTSKPQTNYYCCWWHRSLCLITSFFETQLLQLSINFSCVLSCGHTSCFSFTVICSPPKNSSDPLRQKTRLQLCRSRVLLFFLYAKLTTLPSLEIWMFSLRNPQYACTCRKLKLFVFR